ncbi:MAG TPA: MMPL family transporter, partial [Dehalococcoidia bacterium]|nr:MMPL family transporter [Dehalococcoidia bacterium]
LVDFLKERFPANSGDSVYVVVHSVDGLTDPQQKARVETLLANLSSLPGVANVSSPYAEPGRLSKDNTVALINVQYTEPGTNIEKSDLQPLLDMRDQVSEKGFQVEAGGPLMRHVEQEPPGSAEVIGLTAAVFILLVAFGSVVAMGVPIITALVALATGFFLVGVGTNFVNMPGFTPQFSSMVGIGVGIDYALLIVTRFREALERGMSVADSLVTAAGTAGRSVLFAGSTVVIALLGLWAAGMPAIGWVGTAASLVVALAVGVALIVLPAILWLVGGHINKGRIPGLGGPAHESETGLGYRWSRIVQRNPLLCMSLSLGLLLLLAAPVLDMRLGTSDTGNNPTSFTSRRAYDLLARGFGPGFNGPILLGFDLAGSDPAPVNALPDQLRGSPNVAAVTPPHFNADSSAATITVIPGTAPQDVATDKLVHDLRAQLRESFGGSEVEAFVGGPTAMFIDVGERLDERMPYFFAGVIGISFVLLTAVFRSVVVALKAAVMNLLSIGAAFGILVAVFQWGWLGGVVGVHREGPIEAFMPMMLFAVLFGLSMDYEVFLVSRIREEYLATGDNTEAVARGLSVTSRVISAAAAIMIAVFLAFALSDQRVVKEFGIGLSVAIFVDATVVRLILVPAFMQLMGGANWWFPSWLDRIVPPIGVGHLPRPRIRERVAAGD